MPLNLEFDWRFLFPTGWVMIGYSSAIGCVGKILRHSFFFIRFHYRIIGLHSRIAHHCEMTNELMPRYTALEFHLRAHGRNGKKAREWSNEDKLPYCFTNVLQCMIWSMYTRNVEVCVGTWRHLASAIFFSLTTWEISVTARGGVVAGCEILASEMLILLSLIDVSWCKDDGVFHFG